MKVLIDKSIRAEILKKLLASYNPTPETFVFRDINGVDIDVKSLLRFYQESLYKAYLDEALSLPSLNRKYNDDLSWEKYVEVLISRTAYMNGILYRKQAMGEDYSELYTQIKEIFEYIDFLLKEESNGKEVIFFLKSYFHSYMKNLLRYTVTFL